MSSRSMAYTGPSVTTSWANVRETPYATCSQVMAEPSSHVASSRSVNSHAVASSLGRPVSVARSGSRPLSDSPYGSTITSDRCRKLTANENTLES